MGEDQVALVVLEHLLMSAERSGLHKGFAPNLLWAFLVDVMEQVLRLLAVVPYEVCEFLRFARLHVLILFHCVDVADVLFP